MSETALLFANARREATLSMTGIHVGFIYDGRKTTTLRRKQLAEGWYRLMIGGKVQAGRVYLEPVGDHPIHWPDVQPRDKAWLAMKEGYPGTDGKGDVERFERAVRFIPGGAAFLDGKADMYLHRITQVEPAREDAA